MFKKKKMIWEDSVRNDIFFRYLREEVEKTKLISKPISASERCEFFVEKYKDIELRPCPICNSKSQLTIFLREYTQCEGFAGGYDINAKIVCSKCTCGLEPKIIYTNIRFNNEKDDDSKVEETIFSYVQLWNTRYDDVIKLRLACRHECLDSTSIFVFEDEQNEK